MCLPMKRVIELISFVVSDDHKLFLDTLSMMLSQQDFAVNVAGTVPELVDVVAYYQPNVCLIDRHFVRDSGLVVIGQVIAASAGTKVLVLSADPGTDAVLEALKAGASGYVHKTRGVAGPTAAVSRSPPGGGGVGVLHEPAPPPWGPHL